MGETLVVRPGEKITVEMELTVPAKNNSPYSFNNPLLLPVGIKQPLNKPSLDHVDLITGHITGVIDAGRPDYAVANAGGGRRGDRLQFLDQDREQIPATEMHEASGPDGSTG